MIRAPSNLAAATLLALLLLGVGCGRPRDGEAEAAAPRVAQVRVMTLAPEAWTETIRTYGVFEAAEEVELSVDFSATVRRVSFREGGQVSAGQTLLELDRGEREYPARTESLGAVADPATGNFPVKLTVANDDGLLRPGMTARVELAGLAYGDVILIPSSATVDRHRRRVVFVVRDGKAVEVEPVLAASLGDRVPVLAGLEAGDVLVVGGHEGLVDGSPVEVVGGRRAMTGVYAFFVRRPLLVNLLMTFFIVAGIASLGSMKFQTFPAIDLGIVNVTTFRPGSSGEDVELSLTDPLGRYGSSRAPSELDRL